jgi:hypothetical protein
MERDRRKTRAAVLLTAAVLIVALALSACGGSGSSSSEESTTTTSPGSTGETAGKAESGSLPAASAELTPPDTKLKLGEVATVAYVPYEEEANSGPHAGIEVKVAVTAIEEKSQSDLSGVELEPEEEEKTPYFVKAKLEAVGNEEPPGEENPALRLSAVDDRGQEVQSLTILGEFSPCEEVQPPAHFTEGETFETCVIYLVREGGSVALMKWESGPTGKDGLSEYFEHPVTWGATG